MEAQRGWHPWPSRGPRRRGWAAAGASPAGPPTPAWKGGPHLWPLAPLSQDPEVAAAVAELKALKDAEAAVKQRWHEMVGSSFEDEGEAAEA
jgi:hypothetical protein